MKTQMCVCDRGFSGYDCSSRLCPLGVDPTVSCGATSEVDKQLVRVSKGDYFTLSFEDTFGGDFTTRPIKTDACKDAGVASASGSRGKCNEVQFALMELPNFALPSIEVDRLNLGTTDFENFLLTFSSELTNGKQNTLKCNQINDPSVSGAQPMYKKGSICKIYDVGVPEWFKDDGSDKFIELIKTDGKTNLAGKAQSVILGTTSAKNDYPRFQPCSNKGLCDGATATCKCANGHYGESCEKQSTFY